MDTSSFDNQNINSAFSGISGVTPPTIAGPAPNLEEEKKSHNILAIILGITTAIGIIVAVVGFILFANSQNKIANLNDSVEQLKDTLSETEAIYKEATAAYLEIPDWSVKFRYPEGITKIKIVEKSTFSGQLLITSIIKDNIVYDIDLCGGVDSYRDKPFFLGTIIRWNPKLPAADSPASSNLYQQINKIGAFEYYQARSGGNGCISDEENEKYLTAVNTIRELFSSITTLNATKSIEEEIVKE